MKFPRISRRWRIAGLAGTTTILAAGVVTSVVGWYYAGALYDQALRPDPGPDAFDLVVAAVTADTIELVPAEGASGDGFWTEPGRFGLAWPGGWAIAGDILEIDSHHVVRALETTQGEAPAVGQEVRLDSFVYPGDPATALGLEFEDVLIPAEIGMLPGWLVAGEESRIAILVHGRDAPRREMLRILPAVHAAGYSSLVLGYRNDPDAPASREGMHRFGATEWADLEAAVDFAMERGATEVVLVGYSMGGAIVLSFLQHSPLAPSVRGVILDAPLLSLGHAVDFQAGEDGIWRPITVVGKRFATWRYEVDWHEVDYRSFAESIGLPVLLFHGSEDKTTPVRLSDRLAEMRPDNVTYLKVQGAGHVRSWNVQPAAYEAAVSRFLTLTVPNTPR